MVKLYELTTTSWARSFCKIDSVLLHNLTFAGSAPNFQCLNDWHWLSWMLARPLWQNDDASDDQNRDDRRREGPA